MILSSVQNIIKVDLFNVLTLFIEAPHLQVVCQVVKLQFIATFWSNL